MIDELFALEVKATTTVSDTHLRGLRAFGEEAPKLPRLRVSFDENDRITDDGIRLPHWRRFIQLLWSDGFCRTTYEGGRKVTYVDLFRQKSR